MPMLNYVIHRLKYILLYDKYPNTLNIIYTEDIIYVTYSWKTKPPSITKYNICLYTDGYIYSKIYNFLFKDILNVWLI
jgi:hypothetical protein